MCVEFIVYDNPKEEGIDLEIFEDGFELAKLFVPDKTAQELVDIIQNKLNGRLK